MKMVWDWRVPDIHEINRALYWLSVYQYGGREVADKAYAKQPYGHLPCWVRDAPDLGVEEAVQALWVMRNDCRRLTEGMVDREDL